VGSSRQVSLEFIHGDFDLPHHFLFQLVIHFPALNQEINSAKFEAASDETITGTLAING
jgi:hypothetical protein